MEKTFIFLCCLVGVSQGFLFWGSKGRQEAEREVDLFCQNRVDTGDCGFYTCFDLRHPCERHNWALSYGWRYCSSFNREYSSFTAEAQKWINDTRTCTMKHLLSFYNEQYINCEDVEHEMKRAHATCEEDNGVCNAAMLKENKHALMDVYKISRRGMVRFLMFVKQCGGTQLNEFISWMSEHGKDKLHTAMDLFEDLFP